MVRVRGLVKSFGGRVVLHQVHLDAAPGERLVIVGPNGAGKTTLLRILATLSRPTSGSAQVAGFDVVGAPDEVRRRIGFLSHQPLLYEYLSAEENLRFYGQMYDVPDLNERSKYLLQQVGLYQRRTELVRTFSRGLRQRLAIARALLGNPSVLLLDEPYTGLDQQAEEALDALLCAEDSRTVLLTTHSLEQGLRLGTSIVMLIQGHVVYQMGQTDWDPERFCLEYRRRALGRCA